VLVYTTNIAVFIPIRLGSSRLSKKPLIKIKGKPLIEHLIERVKTAKLPDQIILCTTTMPEDSVFIGIARKCNVKCFRGSEKDILDRFLNAAIKYSVDFIVNVDGDDIFCDPELMDKTVNIFHKTDSDFIKWNELPLGASPVGIKVEALKKAWEMKDESDTETGWGMYFTDTGLFDVEYEEPEDEELKHPEIRMTLDYPEDLKFVKEIFNRLYIPGKVFTLREILRLLRKEPHLAEINKGVQGEYWKRFKQRAKIKLRRKS
jgi:spore coat polysaccharide biosynthesis protein SpsF (cytidylyltransferase family)